MAVNFPASLDSFTDPSGTSLLTSPDHAGLHTDINGAVEALEAKVGVSSGTPKANLAFLGSGNGTSSWGSVWNNATFGTPSVTGGTINNAIVGTPRITGGTASAFLLGTSQITGGTLANAAIGTPTILGGTILINGTTVPLSFGAAIVPTVGTLADAAGGTIALNAQAAQLFEITLGTTAGNRTLGTPSNPVNGQLIKLRVKQNTNNTGTLVFPAIYRFGDAGTLTLGTQSTWNYGAFVYSSGDTKWDHQGNSTGLI